MNQRLVVSPIASEFLLQEFLETLEGVSTLIMDWLFVFSLWMVVDSWEPFDHDAWDLILSSINLGDDEFFSEVGEFLSEFHVVLGELYRD